MSDNLVVLGDRDRSDVINLLSSTDQPVEFEVSLSEPRPGEQDGREFLRWAPSRTVAPPHGGVPFRLAFRPPDSMESEEYVVRFKVTATALDAGTLSGPPTGDVEGNDGDEVIARVRVQPVIEVVVYLRGDDYVPPPVQVERVAANESNEFSRFKIMKDDRNQAFVGFGQLIDNDTGRVLDVSRVHIGQASSQFELPIPNSINDAVCLKLWNTLSTAGRPYVSTCIE